MSRKSVVLTAEERAICRVRYRQVATYMDPGSQPMTSNDRIVQAIAGHWKNGKVLEHGPEHSDLLFPFGNKRAVSRHVNKGGAETEAADREIAWEWVEAQPENRKEEIIALLGLADKASLDKVKDEEDVKEEAPEEPSVNEKRKHDVDDAEEEKFSKRQRQSEGEGSTAPNIKQEVPADVTSETLVKTEA